MTGAQRRMSRWRRPTSRPARPRGEDWQFLHVEYCQRWHVQSQALDRILYIIRIIDIICVIWNIYNIYINIYTYLDASTELDLSPAHMQLVLAEWSPYLQRLSILCPCRSPIPSYRLLLSCNWDMPGNPQVFQQFTTFDWWWFMLFHLSGQQCISGSSRIGCGAGHEEGTILRLVSKNTWSAQMLISHWYW